MLRSRAVAKKNPSNSCNTMLIFGIGKGFLTNYFFTPKITEKVYCAILFWYYNKPIGAAPPWIFIIGSYIGGGGLYQEGGRGDSSATTG
jgi:hypothetical protein